MARLVVWFLAVYGLANIIAVLKAGRAVRELARWVPPWYWVEKDGKRERRSLLFDLVCCPACLAFWIGLAIALFVWRPPWRTDSGRIGDAIIYGLAGSGWTWLLHAAAMRIAPPEL